MPFLEAIASVIDVCIIFFISVTVLQEQLMHIYIYNEINSEEDVILDRKRQQTKNLVAMCTDRLAVYPVINHKVNFFLFGMHACSHTQRYYFTW